MPGAAHDDVAVVALRRPVGLVFKKSQERLQDAIQFGNLVDDEADRRLRSSVRILLQLVAGFNETGRACDDEFAAPYILMPW